MSSFVPVVAIELGCFPYTPKGSMAALMILYQRVGDWLWRVYGPHDAFKLAHIWFSSSYVGVRQAPMLAKIVFQREESASIGWWWFS
ncbi:MAG: glucoamylase family protein [Candidatus Sulfotelmatobacter sp.]